MAKVTMTADLLREILHYEPSTGVFTWRIQRRGAAQVGAIAGSLTSHGYWVIRFMYVNYRAHRLAWLYMHSAWPRHEIDHINGDKTDNRIANLRDVPRVYNLQNRRRPNTNKQDCLPLGVRSGRRGFRAAITVDGQWYGLGSFPSPEAAHAAYVLAKRQLHPGGML